MAPVGSSANTASFRVRYMELLHAIGSKVDKIGELMNQVSQEGFESEEDTLYLISSKFSILSSIM